MAASLLSMGQRAWAIRVLLYTMLLGSAFGAFAHGTARSSAVLGVLGAIIGIGIFLKLAEVFLAGVISVALLGLLNYAE